MKIKKNNINIIIAGIGGQGVGHLSRCLWTLVVRSGHNVHGSFVKGGAQSLGSIYSTMRIFVDKNIQYENYSHQILENDLDLLIALEPYESLRYKNFFNDETKIICSTNIVKPWVGPLENCLFEDPVAVLFSCGRDVIAKDFQALAIQKHNNVKAAGLEMMIIAMENNFIPYNAKEIKEIYWSSLKTF